MTFLIKQPPNGVDPILFVQNLFVGYIFDENGNPVNIGTVFPKQINELPRVVLNAHKETQKFISIPAIRRRWTAPFTMECWTISVEQRYAVEQSIMKRMDAITHNFSTQLADNYVFMWYDMNEPKDNVKAFGQPVFTVGFEIKLMYDTLSTSRT